MNKLIKTILAIILLLISILLFIKSYIFFAILSIIFSILSVVTIFKHEKIIIAFYYLKRNKLNKSLKILESIKNPENLIKSQYAYYNYLFGVNSTRTLSTRESFDGSRFIMIANNFSLKIA